MKYLFLVGHPAHVHLFKNVIRAFNSEGHSVLVGAVARETTSYLLRVYGVSNFVFGQSQAGLLGKAIHMIPKDLVLLKRARDFRPDVIISTGSPYAAHVSAILSVPHLAFGDTEHAKLVARLALPFTDAICTPAAFADDFGPKHYRYNGYKELAYLHPKYFRPNPSVRHMLDLGPSEPYLILRLASWDSSHDLRDHGFRFTKPVEMTRFIRELEQYGRVFVTSDQPLAPELSTHQPRVPPERMHDLLAFASLYIGEGATMAAEAGVLGVPWIYVSTRGRGFLSDQQNRYGLGYWTHDAGSALLKVREICGGSDRVEWQSRRARLLAEKEDVVEFILRFVKSWPRSDNGHEVA